MLLTLQTPHVSALPLLSSLPPQARGTGEPGGRALGHQISATASLDPALRVLAADAEFFRQFGRDSSNTCGHSLYELLHPSATAVLNRHFARLVEGRRTRFTERVVALRGADEVFSAELTGIAVQSEGNRPQGFVVMIRPDLDAPGMHEDSPAKRKPLLTELDAQILEGVAGGASTVQLASKLYLSRQGVEYHVGLMLRRLKAPNRAALVARAHSLGMFTVGSWPPRVLPEFVKDPDNRRTRTAEGDTARHRTRAAAAHSPTEVVTALPSARAE